MSEKLSEGTASQPQKSKAGRNLPAAITVGVVLGGLLAVGLFFVPVILVCLAASATAVGAWEVTNGLNQKRGMGVPVIPAVVAAATMPFFAYYGGAQWLIFGVVASSLLVIIWRLFGSKNGMIMSIMGSMFVMGWVPFLISLALLLYREDTGVGKVFTIVVMAIGNDTWGYIAGVRWGKRPMAPKISPKKTWEGFAGSMLGSFIVGIICMVVMGERWWFGLIIAFFLVIASTVGDLAESMVKREIGIKDMSNILPGHGGVMDRLDSIVFAIAAGYVIFELLDPWSLSL
ncbi:MULTISPECIES: phosphatidate cytidylyltransferase [unclassified Rothia (in: high G+C Gram-positive bacteria)]|uniref:phosphatidate cytidylyltransferase n=1 Tax=unclassified Rothia (in: high G+C Gram-positive bacteria) TaxID=2689056 RepID=UPI00195CA5BF|nr:MULTISPECIES: phosphatidate cytidylyltransferase [unclassified Rothia (in: high G+C Gram-positive bacteria)]MBM7051331.1 phosphatidate cytidylyltransferase [Rothia sp. ZJ1223]QRZ61121.1 phosphatidate cytidylyltransferase [Rothia sp. ZJ932]